MIHRRSLPSLILVAAGLLMASRAAAQPQLQDWQKEGALTRKVFGDDNLSPPRSLACRNQPGACVAGPDQLAYQPTGKQAFMDQCKVGGSKPLTVCYDVAVDTLHSALNTGALPVLFEAAYRARDVFARAAQTSNAPGWLNKNHPNNRLDKFFKQQGVDTDELGDCDSSDSDYELYQCLGGPTGPPRATYRSAVGVLDHHNDLLVNRGITDGAMDRLKKIFAGATGATTAKMIVANKFDPRLGPGMQRMDLLGKMVYLRALSKDMTAEIDAEVAFISGVKSFVPEIANPPIVEARLALFGAQRASMMWSKTQKKNLVLDAQIHGDLLRMYDAVEKSWVLTQMREDAIGLVPLEVHMELAKTWSALTFDRLPLDRDFATPLTDIPGIHLGEFSFDGTELCDWWTVTDHTMSITQMLPVIETEQVWIPDCLPRPWDPEDPCDPEEDGHWETITTTTWIPGATTTWNYQIITAQSIRDNYALLLNADDDNDGDGVADFVDVDGNGEPDHDYSTTSGYASVSMAGFHATDCLAEATSYSGAFNNAVDASDLNCSETGSDDCQSTYGSGSDYFLPYHVAVRICPSFVANAVGINEVGLSANGQELTSVDRDCPTAVEYVARVADSLKDAPEEYLDKTAGLDGPLDALLADFAYEGLLLTAPVSGMFRQRATMAYFSSQPLTSCNDTPINDCTGLGVLLARTDLGLDASRKGLALLNDFTKIDRNIHDLVGNDAIPEYAADGLDSCDDGDVVSCMSNSQSQNRALFYRRVREMLATYRSLRKDQLEVLARYMDKMPSECVESTDTDSDGEDDSYSCDASNADCSSFCSHFDDAVALVADTKTDIDRVVADLSAHKTVLDGPSGSADLATFDGEVIDFANTIPAAIDADFAMIVRGVDWLGDRKGDWAVVSTSDAATDVAAQLSSLAIASDDFADSYDDWVRGYLDQLTKKLNFGTAASNVMLASTDNVADLCNHVSDGSPAPDGCGSCAPGSVDCTSDGLALTTTNPTADHINQIISDNVCDLSVDEFPDIAVNLADPSDPNYPGPTDDYVVWATDNGIAACPKLPTLDIDSLTASYNGTLIEQDVLGMKAALLDIEWAAKDIKLYVGNMVRAKDLFDQYTDVVQTYNSQQATKEWLGDIAICGASVLGAVALAVFPEPTGATKAASAAAWIGAGKTCTARFATGTEDLFPNDGNLSAEQLAFANSLMQSQLRESEQVYTLIGKIEHFVQKVSNYESLIIAFRSRISELKRTATYGNTALDNLSYYSTFSDSSFIQFEEESLNNKRSEFRVYARMVQDLRRTVVYDIGNKLPENSDYTVNGAETYYMPAVAELTILSSYGASFASAWDNLDTTTMTDGDKNLVSTASLLDKIFLDFRLTYGDRSTNTITKFVGTDLVSGLQDDDGDGLQDLVGGELQFGDRGEKAMLGDSRFYDPSEATPSGCAKGWVDVSDYCTSFANTGGPVIAGNCADIRTMPLLERTQLAHLDHMVRSESVETFACEDNLGTYTIHAGTGSGTSGRFNGVDMPFPNWAAPSTVWARGIANTFSQSYYDAQTATVRKIMDTYLDGIESSDKSLSVNAKFYPGHFAYHIDMDNDVFEPEADLFNDVTKAPQTMSEQFVGAALFCTDGLACGVNMTTLGQATEMDLVLFGDSYKANRCRWDDPYITDILDESHRYTDGTTRQAQITFKMDHDLITTNALSHTTPEATPLLDDALSAEWFNARPLHTKGMMFLVRGIYKDGDVADNINTWAPYTTLSTLPVLRLAVRYSYYDTDAIVGAANIDLDTFLTCDPNTAP